MARIRKKFTTKQNADEMREFVEKRILIRKELRPFFSVTTWKDNSLYLESRFCSGVVTLKDREVVIDLELKFFGLFAKRKLEAAIENNFKLLTDGEQVREESSAHTVSQTSDSTSSNH